MKNNYTFVPSGHSTMSSEIKNALKYNNWLISKIHPYIGKSILEIGTGFGNFYELLRPLSEKYYSVDVDKNAIEHARKQYPDGYFIQGDISAPDFADSHIQGIDTIICFNVLEHIENDKAAMHNMFNILRDDGYMIIFVPAFRCLYSSMDKLAGHYRRYTFNTFTTLLKGLRIDIITLEYFNPIGGIGWYLNKFLKHKNLNDKSINNQIVFFDKYLVPLSRLLNPLTKKLFGQSMLFIAKKSN